MALFATAIAESSDPAPLCIARAGLTSHGLALEQRVLHRDIPTSPNPATARDYGEPAGQLG